MAAEDILILGAGDSGSRLAKRYWERNSEKSFRYSLQNEPGKDPQEILQGTSGCTILIAELGENAGSVIAPDIAKHAAQLGRVFAVVTIPFPSEKPRREHAVKALGRLQEYAETVFVMDLGKVLKAFPADAIAGEVMREADERILDVLDIVISAYQADHAFSADTIKEKLPLSMMDVKCAEMQSPVKQDIQELRPAEIDAKALQQEIAEISANRKECVQALNEFITKCSNLSDTGEKRKTAEMIADVYYKLAENYMNGLDMFGSLSCVAGCRRLHETVPSSEHIVYQLLQCMTGYFYVQISCMQDNENVKDWMEEIFELAENYSEEVSIQQQAAVCIQNLMAQCGGFFSPLSLAYSAAERMDGVAARFPKDYTLQNIYAHILISACFFGKETNNKNRLSQFMAVLEHLVGERRNSLDVGAVWAHLREVGLK